MEEPNLAASSLDPGMGMGPAHGVVGSGYGEGTDVWRSPIQPPRRQIRLWGGEAQEGAVVGGTGAGRGGSGNLGRS